MVQHFRNEIAGKHRDEFVNSETSSESTDGTCWATARQNQILTLISDGLTDKQVAKNLGLSTRTIRCHLDRLFLAHGLHNRASAVAAWLRATESTTAPR